MTMAPKHDKRIAIVLLRNSRGEYFAHQRRSDKRTFPGLFGLGAGGSIEAGENAKAGAERELFEETGLVGKVTPLFEFDYAGDEVCHLVSVHEFTTLEAPGHDASEWDWSGWLPEERIDELARRGRLCPDTEQAFARYRALKKNH